MARMTIGKSMFVGGAVAMLVACTPGAPPPPSGPQGAVPGAVIIQVSLLKYGPTQTPDGVVAGYSNDNLTIPVGTVVQFHNQDNFTHTASSVGTSGFGNPPGAQAQTQSGSDLAQSGWSSGVLGPNAYSQALTASTPGTYYYGCFFHFNTPMRGRIVVQ